MYMLQLMNEISEGVILSQLPRLLGVYPVISSNPQLDEFANTWRSYGSVKQLQVQIEINNSFPGCLTTGVWVVMFW